MLWAPVQISQNPKLTKLNLPMLEAMGGPLIIQNNTALTSLASLEHLAAVNATGKVPSVTIPGLQVLSPSYTPLLMTKRSAAMRMPVREAEMRHTAKMQ